MNFMGITTLYKYPRCLAEAPRLGKVHRKE
jgi:hypothetical protein